jgi:hypothetical protein
MSGLKRPLEPRPTQRVPASRLAPRLASPPWCITHTSARHGAAKRPDQFAASGSLLNDVRIRATLPMSALPLRNFSPSPSPVPALRPWVR